VGIIIGTHQTITVGFQESYWIFMLTFAIYLVFAYYRGKNK
jgi:F0F1-type ATP synthase membrane subunit c/vacuolar-type H+-ATPase subunit K